MPPFASLSTFFYRHSHNRLRKPHNLTTSLFSGLFVMTVFTGGFGEAALNKVEPSTIEKEAPYEYADSKVHNMQGNQRGG